MFLRGVVKRITLKVLLKGAFSSLPYLNQMQQHDNKLNEIMAYNIVDVHVG